MCGWQWWFSAEHHSVLLDVSTCTFKGTERLSRAVWLMTLLPALNLLFLVGCSFCLGGSGHLLTNEKVETGFEFSFLSHHGYFPFGKSQLSLCSFCLGTCSGSR